MRSFRFLTFLLGVAVSVPALSAERHQNFNAAIYARVYEVRQMDDLQWLDERFEIMQKHLKIDKIYLETHRDLVAAEQATLDKVKKYFHDRGIKTSGGITITVNESNRFETYCYSNPEHRNKLKEVVELTARNFDEIILDDFFFTNCKCARCIAAKGEQSWTNFRLKLLTDAAETLVLKPAKKVNPKVKVIIKYPNWYEHFQGLGFNLETGPQLFDGVYTGTETRDPSSNYDEMIKPALNADGSYASEARLSLLGGYALDQVDRFLGELGEPVGIKSYKPFHSVGEDFLQTYLGMIGIPMDLTPEFPQNEKMVVLTESASFDPNIVAKMKKQLMSANNVLITSGLLRALGSRLDDIVELRHTDRKASVNTFRVAWGPMLASSKEMLIPQIQYLTNDSWEEISAFNGTNGWPLLHSAGYAQGTLYVLTIPENFVDLHHLPAPVLNAIRSTVSRGLPVRLEGPGQISLFLYNNNTLIVESFLDEAADIALVTKSNAPENLLTGERLAGETVLDFRRQQTGETRFKMTIMPHSFMVFRM